MTTDIVTPPVRPPLHPSPAGWLWHPGPGPAQGLQVGRWVVIIAFLIAALVPFYYMLLLSVKPIESLLRDPASMIVSPSEFTLQTYVNVLSSPASADRASPGSSPTAPSWPSPR